MTTVVLVCGGRDYGKTVEERNHIYRTLDQVHAHYGELLVVDGDYVGTDRTAGLWAGDRGVHRAAVRACWNKLGPAAGPLRNAAMLALSPHLVVAFPGGAGTADMKAKARAAEVPVYEV